jgi:competence protein ComEA
MKNDLNGLKHDLRGLLLHFSLLFRVLLFGLLGLAGVAQVQADPPRVLKTSFEDYARQQQQHDETLTRQPPATTTKTATISRPSAVSKSTASAKSSTPVNINTADESSLSNTLVGIGPAKARAIVEYRQKNGQFKKPEDLLAVKGIGPATLEKNRSRIRLH